MAYHVAGSAASSRVPNSTWLTMAEPGRLLGEWAWGAAGG